MFNFLKSIFGFRLSSAVSFAVFLFVPLLSLAQPTQGGPSNFAEFVGVMLSILDPLILIIIGLTVIVFLWGLAKFILKVSDEREREKGKRLMVWGIAGLFVMVSVWGIVQILVNTFLGDTGGGFVIPFLPV